MKVDITDKYILLINNESSLEDFLINIENQYNDFEKSNLIIDLTNDIKKSSLSVFKEFSKKHKKNRKSLVIIIKEIDLDKTPKYLMVVPTLLEAIDVIELEEIERDLGF